MVVYAGESVEEVREIIEKDVYATIGVWDLEKVEIIPVSSYLWIVLADQLIKICSMCRLFDGRFHEPSHFIRS